MTGRCRSARAARRLPTLLLVIAAACADSSEGESCNPENGDDDCETGLVCTPAHAVAAREAVCCLRPPARSSSTACAPEVPKNHVSDPSIDGSFAAGGTGFGGSAGASAGGSAGIDASAGGAGDGSAGAAGQAGSSPADGGGDAPADSGAAGADAEVG